MGILNPYFYAYNPELLAFENAWIKFIKTQEIKSSVIKDDVADSWKRCYALELDALKKEAPDPISKKELDEKLEKNHELLRIVTPFMTTLFNTVKQSGFRVDFIDPEGYILKSFSEGDVLEISKKTKSVPGAYRSEKVVGTNSIALAIKTKKPIQIAGSEHYMQIFHRWACSSAPILGKDNEVWGVLNISGRYELVNVHTLGMVSAAVKAIENEIKIQEINQRLVKNNSQLRTTLEIVTDGIAYIENDVILQVNKELCRFLGKSQQDIIGKNVYQQIITTPGLDGMMHNENNIYKDSEIILRGSKRSYKCLFGFETVFGENNKELGKVMIFTRVDEIQALASKIKYLAKYTFDDIIGNSLAIKSAIDIAKKASQHDTRIIIEGESGTGKEMFAQAIHNNSSRKYGPFIAVDCGALSIELLESELFGYDKGAFTGASKDGKVGIFEIANKGTIFLDEIGNMPPEMQIKMLRVLQEGVFTKVGGTRPISTDVRIIAATNVHLEEAVAAGAFRQDLFYRLNVFYIKTPPLRERKEDIPLLVEHFIHSNPLRKQRLKLDSRAERALMDYGWPGNIRQLNNMVERALIMCADDQITLTDFPYELYKEKRPDHISSLEEGMGQTLKEVMNSHIIYIVRKCNDNISKAAKILGVSRATVYKALNETERELQ